MTDSEVNKKRSLNFRLLPIEGIQFGSPAAVIGWLETGQLKALRDSLLSLAAHPHRGAPALAGLSLTVHLNYGNCAGARRGKD